MSPHRFDPLSAVFGLLFTIVGLAVLIAPEAIERLDAGLIVGVVTVLAGAGVLLSLLSSPRDDR